MHTPLTPADVEIDEQGLPFSPTYGDVYHPQAGAIAQAQHVFLAGNELPRRWQGRTRYTLVETGFGLGHNFLATWQAWRSDPQRPARLHYVSIDKHPVRGDTLRALLSRSATGALDALAQQLLAQWPPLVSGMHRLVFEHGQVELLLCLGDVASALRQLTLSADAFYLDGFAPARNPAMWHSALYPQLARLARTGATLATWSASHRVRADLAACGFTVQAQPGFGGKREMTVAHFSPRHTPRFSAPWASGDSPAQHRHALVVGAGLAGCATVAALAAQGWHSTLIDAHAHIAAGASGNARGVFHGVVHAADNPHARLGRAAALELDRALAGLAPHTAALQWSRGLLRLAPGVDVSALQQLVDTQRLPADYVQALGAAQASVLAGLPLACAAWWYPGGGALSPAGLCAAQLASAGAACTLRLGHRVAALRRTGSSWVAEGAEGQPLARAPVVVLAHAPAVQQLAPLLHWPVTPVRGQAQRVLRGDLPLRMALAGTGYVSAAPDGWLHFGATSTEGDDDDAVRSADSHANVERLHALLGDAWPAGPLPLLSDDTSHARAGVRWQSRDRLPLIGALPDDAAAASAPRGEQPRFVPRQAGLYCFAAPGSRGIAWSVYGARVLAAWVTGAPFAIEADLRDALDPARFAARARRLPTSAHQERET